MIFMKVQILREIFNLQKIQFYLHTLTFQSQCQVIQEIKINVLHFYKCLLQLLHLV